jgi:hypothetical protein
MVEAESLKSILARLTLRKPGGSNLRSCIRKPRATQIAGSGAAAKTGIEL